MKIKFGKINLLTVLFFLLFPVISKAIVPYNQAKTLANRVAYQALAGQVSGLCRVLYSDFYHKDTGFQSVCSGVLIAPRHVLTSARRLSAMLMQQEQDNGTISVSFEHQTDSGVLTNIYSASRFTPHPGYLGVMDAFDLADKDPDVEPNVREETLAAFDFALLELDSPVLVDHAQVAEVPLVSGDLENDSVYRDACKGLIVAGYGCNGIGMNDPSFKPPGYAMRMPLAVFDPCSLIKEKAEACLLVGHKLGTCAQLKHAKNLSDVEKYLYQYFLHHNSLDRYELGRPDTGDAGGPVVNSEGVLVGIVAGTASSANPDAWDRIILSSLISPRTKILRDDIQDFLKGAGFFDEIDE